MKRTDLNTALATLAADPSFSNAGVGIAACTLTVESQSDGWCQLLPAGHFKAVDGRPHDVPGGQWFIDAAIAAQVIGQVEARINPLVIDYEHQTLHAEKNGQPAPAAGRFNQLEWREGSGLWIKPQWTARAAEFISGGEYAYLSAVFPYNVNTGHVLGLHSAALVNTPGLDGMAAVALRAAVLDRFNHANPAPEEEPMNELLLALLKQLGIDVADDAKEADIDRDKALGALKALQDKADQVTTELATLKAAGDKPDPQKYAPMEVVTALQQQVAALSQQTGANQIDQLIKDAKDDGRLLPAMEAWARELGEKDIAALKGFLDSAQPLAALKGLQTAEQKPPQGNGDSAVAALSEEDKEAARLLGKSEAEYAKLKAAQQ